MREVWGSGQGGQSLRSRSEEARAPGRAAERTVPLPSASAQTGLRIWQAAPCFTPRVFPQVELKSQEAESLQQQRDQYASHLQQYVAAFQQLASDKEVLQKQVLLQTQLMDRLQHEEVQGKVDAELARQELQETQVRGLERQVPRGGPATCYPFSLFPGPSGTSGSCHPAEPATPGAAEPHGYA